MAARARRGHQKGGKEFATRDSHDTQGADDGKDFTTIFPTYIHFPYKILLVQVGTLSFSHPSFGVPVLFIYLADRLDTGANLKKEF